MLFIIYHLLETFSHLNTYNWPNISRGESRRVESVWRGWRETAIDYRRMCSQWYAGNQQLAEILSRLVICPSKIYLLSLVLQISWSSFQLFHIYLYFFKNFIFTKLIIFRSICAFSTKISIVFSFDDMAININIEESFLII